MGFETFLYHNVTAHLESYPKTKKVLSTLFAVCYKNTILNKKYRFRKSIQKLQRAIKSKEIDPLTIDDAFVWSAHDNFQLAYNPVDGTGFFPKSANTKKSISATLTTNTNPHIYDQQMLDALARIEKFRKLKINTIVDVGANAGAITLGFAKKYPQATIFAYEPIPQTYAILDAIVKKNKENQKTSLKNVTTQQLAVGAAPSTLYMTTNLNTGNHFISKEQAAASKNVTRVSVVTLDNESKKHNITPDVIKIDVEGAEWQVLQGAKKLIDNHKPILILELFDPWLARNKTSAKEIVTYLKSIGYKYYCVDSQSMQSDSLADDLRANTNFLFYKTG